jgi:hypothetical protein
MNFLLKLVNVESITAYIVGVFTTLSSTQWKEVRNIVLQAVIAFPKEKELRLPWVKAQIHNLAKENGWTISEGDINFSVEIGVKILKFLKVIPS